MGGDFNFTRNVRYLQPRFEVQKSPTVVSVPVVPVVPVDLEKDSTSEGEEKDHNREEHPNVEVLSVQKKEEQTSRLLGDIESKFISLVQYLDKKIDRISDQKPQDIKIVLPDVHQKIYTDQEKEEKKSFFRQGHLNSNLNVQNSTSSSSSSSTPPILHQNLKLQDVPPYPDNFWSNPANVALVQALIVIGIVFLVMLISYIIFLFVYKTSGFPKYNMIYPR